jgi:hypothetical protein
LKLDRGGHGVSCTAKHDEERIALTIDHLTAKQVERSSKQSSVIRENALVLIAERLEQPRRALDVGEEKRYGAGRKLSHIYKQSLARVHSKAKRRLQAVRMLRDAIGLADAQLLTRQCRVGTFDLRGEQYGNPHDHETTGLRALPRRRARANKRRAQRRLGDLRGRMLDSGGGKRA